MVTNNINLNDDNNNQSENNFCIIKWKTRTECKNVALANKPLAAFPP